ncbi:MAG: LysR family transcriptional regulator [Actinobacteria bacterium]|nr:LysR family transcriptional regulator [Actinomycetota bacterium]
MNQRPIRSPEISELKAFCAAVDLGSIGRAAKFLRISQPALSKRIRGLEAIAGAELLNRSSSGVEPTASGRRLYEEARRALVQIEVVEDLMVGLHDEERPIRIAASHTIAEYVLPERLTSFRESSERHLVVELVVANSRMVLDMAARGLADIAIGAIEPDGQADPRAMLYFDGEVAVAVPRKHPWAKLDEIPLEKFLAEPLVLRDPQANTRRIVDTVLHGRGVEMASPLLELGSTAAVKSAASQRGVPAMIARLGIGPESEGFVTRRVKGMSFPRRFVILAPGHEGFSAQGKAFLDHLLDGAAEVQAFFND